MISPPETVAAVDLGSNSFHMLLARMSDGQPTVMRLAVLLQRGRGPEPLPRIRLDPAKRALVLGFPEGWLDDHPLTRADLEQEAEYLAAVPFSLAFR